MRDEEEAMQNKKRNANQSICTLACLPAVQNTEIVVSYKRKLQHYLDEGHLFILYGSND